MNRLEMLGIVKAAKHVIETFDWCQDANARNLVGTETDPILGSACAFCIHGALCAVTRQDDEYNLKAVREIHRYIDNELKVNIVAFNDLETTTKQDVIDLLDRAIANLEKEIS